MLQKRFLGGKRKGRDKVAYANLSTWDEVLKTFYLPAIQDQLNRDKILTDIIDVNEEDVSGKQATIECRYGRNTGIGAIADGGDLPTATYQKFKTCIVPMKYNYGRVSFTGPTIRATRDTRGAYARVVDTEITGIVDDVSKDINRQLWGCGYGILGRWHTTSTSTSYFLQYDYRGFTTAEGGDGFGSAFGAKYLEEFDNAVAVVISSMSSASAATYTVGTVNLAVSAITYSTAALKYDTITASDPGVGEIKGTFYIRPGNLGAATTGGTHRREMMGLRGIVDNGKLDDIAIFDGTDVGLLQSMFDRIEKKAGKDEGPDLMLTTRAVRNEVLQLWKTDRRFVNTMTLDGGWKALDYNGVPFVVDNDAIDGEIYFLTTRDLQIYRMSDYEWMSKDGAILSRIQNKDAYEATLFRYAELGAKRRNTQGVIADLIYDRDLN